MPNNLTDFIVKTSVEGTPSEERDLWKLSRVSVRYTFVHNFKQITYLITY